MVTTPNFLTEGRPLICGAVPIGATTFLIDGGPASRIAYVQGGQRFRIGNSSYTYTIAPGFFGSTDAAGRCCAHLETPTLEAIPDNAMITPEVEPTASDNHLWCVWCGVEIHPSRAKIHHDWHDRYEI